MSSYLVALLVMEVREFGGNQWRVVLIVAVTDPDPDNVLSCQEHVPLVPPAVILLTIPPR